MDEFVQDLVSALPQPHGQSELKLKQEHKCSNDVFEETNFTVKQLLNQCKTHLHNCSNSSGKDTKSQPVDPYVVRLFIGNSREPIVLRFDSCINLFGVSSLINLNYFFDNKYTKLSTIDKNNPNCIKAWLVMTKNIPFKQESNILQIISKLMMSFDKGSTNGDKFKKLSQIGTYHLTVKDFATLNIDRCLNDSIIDATIYLYNQRSYIRSKNMPFANKMNCYNLGFNCSFYRYVEEYKYEGNRGNRLLRIVRKAVELCVYIIQIKIVLYNNNTIDNINMFVCLL